MRRGEIWTANLNPTRGAEAGKIRPVLIMQADELIQAGANTLVCIPLTSQPHQGYELLRIKISARHRLLRDSYLMVEKLRAVDRARLGEGPLASLTMNEMNNVEKCLKILLKMQ